MSKKLYFIVLFIILSGQMAVFGMGGANTEPVSKKILSNFTFDELRQAQFYLDSTLRLTRVIPRGETRSVEEGTISVVNGERVETIEITNKVGGELFTIDNKGVLGVGFSTNANRVLFFTEQLIGTEYFLTASGSTVKYGEYEYKISKKPKLLLQFSDEFIREKTLEREEGRRVF